MPNRLEPRLDILAAAQREIWARDHVRDLPDVVLSAGLLVAEPERASSI